MAPLAERAPAEDVAEDRAALGEADFTAAWAEGRSLGLGEAVALATAGPSPLRS